jgi:polyisoprenyl-teichoic acid--peptidoglycan teichoic acid transferase
VKRLVAAALVFSALLMAIAVETGLPSAARQEPAFTIHKLDAAHFAGTNGLTFMLVIGSDGRLGVGGNRGDALHVIGVNPAQGRATMLDIPRDTWVNIPGRGQERINSALEFGGQELQARTVSAFTGVPISFSVMTNFDGLIGMVDDLGGVDVDVPQAMKDRFSGADFPQGRVHMNGNQALAFSRNRHIGDGDLTRTYNQGVLILAALAKFRAQPGAAAVVHSLEVLLRRARADGVSVRDLYRLGRLGLSVDPANVRNIVMPSRLGQVGPASVVFPGPGADSLFADFRDDAILQTH